MNYTYDPNVDYSALMQEAIAAGNTQLAAIYEQQRNAKIRGENLQGQYPTTSNYAQYLPYQESDNDASAYTALNTSQKNIAQIGQKRFAYDPKTDVSFQTYRKQALREADRATRETMGAYAAMTQGVPSTAAITAASQAGDYYRAQFADRLPEFEANAYSRWLNDNNLELSKQQLLQNGYSQILNAQQQQYQQRLGEREYALSLLSSGIMPTAEQLSAAGLTQTQAQELINAQAYSTGGGGYQPTSEANKGEPVDLEMREKLGQLYQSGGQAAIASQMDYLAESGFDVDTLWMWILTYYPYTPANGYSGTDNPTSGELVPKD